MSNERTALAFWLSVPVTIALFVAIDLARCSTQIEAAAFAPTVGYIVLSATLLVVVIALALAALRWIGRHVPRPAMRILGTVAIVWYPAGWIASELTSGSGISRSGWAPVVRIGLFLVLTVLSAATAFALPKLQANTSRATHTVVGATLAALGLCAIGLTAFHPITYIRVFRGVLVIGTLLLQVGFAFLLRGHEANRGSRRIGVGLAVVAAASFALTHMGGPHRLAASYTVFADTVIAQKLQPLLLRLSPIFKDSARVTLNDTRLARNNQPAVAPLTPGRYRGANVVVVTFDALRADMIDAKRGGQPVAPTLSDFAANATSFRSAVANYSHTNRSLLSFLAGSWYVPFPSETSVSTDPVEVRARTRLARVFRSAGYETAAVVMSGRWGEVFFTQDRIAGFDQHIAAGSNCEAQVEAFKRFLAERQTSKPYFGWIHIFDTHKPFVSETVPPGFGGSRAGTYAAAVRHVDGCFAQILQAIDRDKTIIVVSADHGEALGEHGRTLQHSSCYWHDVHIPLVVRLPDQHVGRAIDYPIQLADVLPTLTNLLGIPMDEREVDGDDLSGLFSADAVPKETAGAMAFSRGHPQQYECESVLVPPWHLIYTDAAGNYELYNVELDPDEAHNLAPERLDVLNQLQPVVDAFRDLITRGPQ